MAGMAGARGRRKMARLRERDGDLCALCLEPMDFAVKALDPKDPEAPTFDHVVPRWRALDNSDANLVLVHRRCNSRRGGDPFARGMFATVAPDPATATLADVWPEIEALL